jgi:L-2-hydroxycarboxylate dehydrogenase (NAD+)
VFLHFGVPKDDAEQAGDVLACADLRGIDSHGVAGMYSYFGMLSEGHINPKPKIKLVRSTPSTATVDGNNGLGLVVGPQANRIAMAMAEQCGSGWVSVCNTNHFGIAGYYVLKALERDLIGWAMTNSTKLVAPLWGAERMLGTNSIAIGFPGKEEPPIVIDLATSAAAYGKIEIARRKGEPIPSGWAIKREGRDTTSPEELIDGGAMLLLGARARRPQRIRAGDDGGHFVWPAERSELGAVCAAVCAAAGNSEAQRGKGIGHFFGAMRVDGFIDADEFKRQIDDYVRVFRATKPAPGTNGPLIPGDPEREAERVRRKNGVPLILPVIEDLRDISRKTGIPFD